MSVTGDNQVGGLAGQNEGTIDASYATGGVNGNMDVGGLAGSNDNGTIHASYATGGVNGNRDVGGLVGSNITGTIRASYATGGVSGDDRIGGLVGVDDFGTIRASYAIGEISGNRDVGGLLGSEIFEGSIQDSYFDSDTFGSTDTESRTTERLQMPMSYTGIYANWNVDLDNEDSDNDTSTGGDDPWDFGTSVQYPVLQVDFDGDGFKSWEEFGPQSRPGVLVSPRALSLMEKVSIRVRVFLEGPLR